MDLLVSWIQSPDPGISDLGRVLPFFLAPRAQHRGMSGQRSDLGAAALDVLDGHGVGDSGVPVWAWRDDTVVLMCRPPKGRGGAGPRRR